MQVAPKVTPPPIYVHQNHNMYKEHNNATLRVNSQLENTLFQLSHHH